MKKLSIFLLAFLFLFIEAIAQKKIVVLGSSTAEGTGSNPFPDSGWVKKLQFYYQQNTSDGLDTVITNLAVGGFKTYNIMPTGYPSPPSVPVVTTNNITQAISLAPDVIIINLPSNDVTWPFPKYVIMNNFRTLFAEANNNNIKCFITTTQPLTNPDPLIRDSLRTLVDSIKNNFGIYAIDFFNPIVSTDGLYNIRSDVNADGTHVNNLGHRLLFQQVLAKNIFASNAPLPLKLIDFNAQLQSNVVLLKWKTAEEDLNSFFEIQRSSDGRQFTTLERIDANGSMNINDYAFTDRHPLDGKNFYRIKIIEPAKNSYSKIIGLTYKGKELSISSLFMDGSNLNIKINNQKNERIDINIINLAGVVVKKQKQQISSANSNIFISVSDLAAGEYILQITNGAGNADTERFTKLK